MSVFNIAPTFWIGDGVAITEAGLDDYGKSICVLSNGQIFLAGYTKNVLGNYDGFLGKYDRDGKLLFLTNIGSWQYNEYASGFVVAENGSIFVAGHAYYNQTQYEYKIWTLSAEGQITNTQSGTYGYSEASAVCLQLDGKQLFAITSNTQSSIQTISVKRFISEGALDNTFDNNNQLVFTEFGRQSNTVATDIAYQSNGGVLVSGYADNAFTKQAIVFRLDQYGILDKTFGRIGYGFFSNPYGTSDSALTSISTQSDGKILASGYATWFNRYAFLTIRLNPDGTIDSSFNGRGYAITNVDTGSAGANSLVLQPDGKILAGGWSDYQNKRIFTIIRYNSDGSLDNSFGANGIFRTDGDTKLISGEVTDLALQSDGKILVSGFSNDGVKNRITLIQLSGNGSIDTHFHPLVSTLNGISVYVENGSPVVLDSDVQIYDANLASTSYNGASITIARHGGSNSQDHYFASGNISALVDGDAFIVSNTTVGTVVQNRAGILSLCFNSNATQTLVNETLQGISYSNDSEDPPTSVQLDWLFNDGNVIEQGTGGSLTASGSVLISIAAVNDAPVGTTATITTDEDTPATGTLAGTDVDGNTLTFAKVADPSHGTVSINASTGAYTYTPAGNYNGSDSFTFKVNDGTVDSAVATVSITVDAVNDAPVGTTATIATDEDTAATGTLSGTDVDGNTLTFAKVADPSHGTVSINATTGAYTYTPAGNYNGSDSFTFKVNDGTVDSAVATVSITVDAVGYDVSVQTHSWRGIALGGVQLQEEPNSQSNVFGVLSLADLQDKDGSLDGLITLTPRSTSSSTPASAGVTLTDVLAALKIYLGKSLPDAYASPYNYIAADFDGNGSVNLTDVLSLLKFYLGKTTTAAPTWVFVDAADVIGAGKTASILRAGSDSLPIDATHTQPHAIDQDFSKDSSIELVGVLRGDVDGSWTAGS